jgi:membrane associated rhomboid family serine protease
MSDYYSRYETSAPYERDRVTLAVQRLIVVSTLVFVAQLLLVVPFGWADSIPGGLPFNWVAFHGQGPVWGWAWQVFTYMFLHADLSHLFFNMLWLFFFGPEVERALGTRQFYRFFVICGALGVLPSILLGHTVIGGSGAVMAVLVAFAVLNPQRELFFFPFSVPINARALVLIVIVLNVVFALMSSGRTSWATHLGGMAAGYGYMRLVPTLRTMRLDRFKRRVSTPKRPPAPGEKNLDALGRAVDNIFKFEDKKKRG